MWRSILTGEDSGLAAKRRRYRRLPAARRCKVCSVPLRGRVAAVLRPLIRRRPSRMNPNFCDFCDVLTETHRGGAEVELSMLFADVRGSTALAERMSPGEFTHLMNRFFAVGNRVLIARDGLVDKLVGDEVIGLFLPMSAVDHAAKAVAAARELLLATGHADPEGPWLPVGAGVHTGVAYVGAVGSEDTVTDFTAMGDAVNVTARLAQAAGVGEILLTDRAAAQAGVEAGELEERRLELRGHERSVTVRVIRVEPA